MGHTYSSLLLHCVFSTKDRRPWLTEPVRERLWPFIGGIARENGFLALIVNGTADHAHALLSLPTTGDTAKARRLIKGGSSKWLSDTFPELRHFEWQQGYGAFSVSISHKAATINYIMSQAEHHRTKTFKEEFLEFLKKHQIEYEERYVWG